MIVAPAQLQILDRAHEHLHDLRIGAVALVGEAQHADARALQAVAHERRRVVLRQVRRRGSGHRIGGIAADDDLEDRRRRLRRCAPSVRRCPPAG